MSNRVAAREAATLYSPEHEARPEIVTEEAAVV